MSKDALNFLYFLILSFSLFLSVIPSFQSSPVLQNCPHHTVTSTVYNVPDEEQICGDRSRCPEFREAVRINGSGRLRNGHILRSSNKIENIGPCPTAKGAWGTCLIPYISVAADYRHYRNGDIIEIPKMRGRRVQFPNGQFMVHPGFFRVEDTGGAIKGINRFDFFTGTLALNSSRNSFGRVSNPSDLLLYAKNQCTAQKLFRHLERGGNDYINALNKINESLENAGQQSLTNTSPAILRQLQRHQPNPPPSPRPQVPNSTHRPSPGGRK